MLSWGLVFLPMSLWSLSFCSSTMTDLLWIISAFSPGIFNLFFLCRSPFSIPFLFQVQENEENLTVWLWNLYGKKFCALFTWLVDVTFFFSCSMEGISSKTISSIGGLHKMIGLHDFGLAAVARDSIQCLPESSATNKLGASFETPCGRLLVI